MLFLHLEDVKFTNTGQLAVEDVKLSKVYSDEQPGCRASLPTRICSTYSSHFLYPLGTRLPLMLFNFSEGVTSSTSIEKPTSMN